MSRFKTTLVGAGFWSAWVIAALPLFAQEAEPAADSTAPGQAVALLDVTQVYKTYPRFLNIFWSCLKVRVLATSFFSNPARRAW